MKYQILTPEDVRKLNNNECPDCSARIFEGPQGGGSINFQCGSETCGSRFNYVIEWERISEISPLREDGDSTPVEVPHPRGPYR